MGGCSSCSSPGGPSSCGTRKAGEGELLAEILPEVYPSRRWGDPDDAAWFGHGVPETTVRRLARRAAAVLKAPTRVVLGDEDETCDYVEILCVGRAPGVLELAAAEAFDVPDGDHLEERYLRVACSHMAPVAVIQEVTAALDRDGADWVVTASARPGVFDPILLKRTQLLVDLIVEEGVHFLDYGVVEKPPIGYDGSAFRERFGTDPGIVHYLFSPRPAGCRVTQVRPSLVPARAVAP